MLKKIIYPVLASILISSTVSAQTTETKAADSTAVKSGSTAVATQKKDSLGECVAFCAMVPKKIIGLNAKQIASLGLKVKQIIGRNNAGATSIYSTFAIVPEIDIIESEPIEAGMTTVHKLKAEITLSAVSLADDAVYGTVVVKATGSGSNFDKAYNSMLQGVKYNDPTVAKFIINSKQAILNYYEKNINTIKAKAKLLASQDSEEEALVLLNSVPTCVPQFADVEEVMTPIYQKYSKRVEAERDADRRSAENILKAFAEKSADSKNQEIVK